MAKVATRARSRLRRLREKLWTWLKEVSFRCGVIAYPYRFLPGSSARQQELFVGKGGRPSG
jgi:hypothetical protein